MKRIEKKENLRLYYNLVKKYKFVVVCLVLLILFLEITYIADTFLFKLLTDKGNEFFSGLLLKQDFFYFLGVLALVYIFLVLIRSIGIWFQFHLLNRLEINMIADVKKKFFNHILGLSYSFHATNKTGQIISKLIRGSNAIEGITDVFLFHFLPFFLKFILVAVALIYLDWLSLVVIFVVVIFFMIYNKQQLAKLEANKADDYEKSMISDTFTNIESIKYFGKEDSVKRKYSKLVEITGFLFLRSWNFVRWADSGLYLILGFGTFFLIYFSILKFMSGLLSLGDLVFIYTTFGSLVGSMYGFVGGIRGYNRAVADFESLYAYNRFENEIKNKADAVSLKIRDPVIEFKNVDFSYGKRQILHRFNLRIDAYKKVALVGHSGSGKSTVVRLLYRLFDVDFGGILIDNRNIKDFEQESLRSEMSIVPQECILFDDTIYNNIKFSNPQAKKEDILRAIKYAQLDGIIKKFYSGLNTVVGERGVKLSGGEKQRISIARAILANKKIIVLDEATSALDSKTEYEIRKAMDRLMYGKTCIIIAHRLSTIMNADVIVVMDKGKIVQIGKHSQLIRQDGMYKRLWNLQKGGYIK